MVWSALKGAFFEDEGPKTPQPVAKPAAAQPTGGLFRSTPSATPPTAPISMDNKWVEALRRAITARSTAFTQLLQAADALADLMPDPIMRLKAAFRTSAAGRTPQQVVAAVDIHLADLDSEARRFKTSVEQTLTTDLNTARTALASATAQIEDTGRQIQAMQERIIGLQNAQSTLTGQIATKELELSQTQAEFEAALAIMRSELQTQRDAIANALS